MNIAFISSYPPRKCGIATYTRDLSEMMIKQGEQVKIFAMENASMDLSYPRIVAQKIRQNEFTDYENAASIINKSNIDIVHIQHEFGLFGGNDGDFIVKLAALIQKPLVVTFHTVLLNPRLNQKNIMQEMARLSSSIIIMEPIAKDRLINVYDISPQKTNIIYHGVPSPEGIDKRISKKELNLEKHFVVIANNLIARNKGYEYVIQALPEITKIIPSLLFIIIGETHPLVKLSEGEKYREELIDLTAKLEVSKFVKFVNEYISLDLLRKYLSAADIYITPYLDPEQITSGTLSYALGAGKACISTPYIYAKNMLADGRGILVPFRDSKALGKAVVELFSKPEKRKSIERKAKILGRKMRWDKVSEKHNQLYKKITDDTQKLTYTAKSLLSKKLDLRHLDFLTDNMGMLQHTHYAIPERRFGYSTDDNARALIIIAGLFNKKKSAKLFNLMKLYISYLHLAQEANGKFHTFLNFQHSWIDIEEVSDPYGKALWSLGYFLYICPDTVFSQSVDMMFRKSLERIDSISNLRTAAYVILGLYFYYKRFEGEKEPADVALIKIKQLSEYIMAMYRLNSDRKWSWFEHIVTYDNFRIPQALFASFLVTGNEEYKRTAIESLDFLLKHNYQTNGQFFDFIGQNGWLEKNKEKAIYDQQPIEAAGAVDALIFAYRVTKLRKYLDLAMVAFEWFIGKNRNRISLLDDRTGGVYDGLTPRGLNQNQGAESLVCFLIAQFHLKQYLEKI